MTNDRFMLSIIIKWMDKFKILQHLLSRVSIVIVERIKCSNNKQYGGF